MTTTRVVRQTIRELIQQQSSRAPHAIAIVAPDQPPLTYAALDRQVSQTAITLQKLGFGVSDRLAIVLESNAEAVTVFLAITAFAISAPLNPMYSSAEFKRYFQSLGITGLVVRAGQDSPARSAAKSCGIPIIELLAQPNQLAGCFELVGPVTLNNREVEVARTAPDPDAIALLLQTSGTTAMPKVVPLTHQNLATAAFNFTQSYNLQPDDRCLMIVPLFHSQGLIGAVIASVAAGGQIVCPGGFDASRFWDWLEEYQPTWYTAVPTMNQAIFAAAPDVPTVRSSLRFIRSAAATIPPQLLQELEALLQVPVIEGYGMTEAYQLTANPLPPHVRKPGSVGRPVNSELQVVGEKGEVLGADRVGEILVRGGNVIAGYEAVASSINDQTFRQGWLHTGDQGYFDADGYLFLTARLKELIKQGGEQITPREIDAVLLQHPAIQEAVTFGIPHPSLGEVVAAAVVCKPDQSITETALREFVGEHLAAYKVPSQIISLDRLPKGATGKVQRLGMADRLAEKLAVPFVSPTTALELTLTDLWQSALGISHDSPIGIDDNFFALGGDSLRATQLLVQIEAKLDCALPPDMIFRNLTIGQLAIALTEKTIEKTIEKSNLVTIRAGGDRPPLFGIHDISGKVACYRHLANHLDADRPFYGIQAPSWPDPLETFDISITAIANTYIADIKTIQPTGPYHLMGYSFGGLVAFEMACQLQQQGEPVNFLGLLDSHVEGDFKPFGRRRKLRRHWQQLRREGLGYPLTVLQNRLSKGSNPQLDIVNIEILRQPLAACLKRASIAYVPQYYHGPLHYYDAQDDHAKYHEWFDYEPFALWSDRSQSLVCEYVPGAHELILQDGNVQIVAAKLNRALIEAVH
jgi:oxalate---CoA ligase